MTLSETLLEHSDETIREYSYNKLYELISEETLDSCEYDSAGNLIQKGDTHFVYDGDHKLIKVFFK